MQGRGAADFMAPSGMLEIALTRCSSENSASGTLIGPAENALKRRENEIGRRIYRKFHTRQ